MISTKNIQIAVMAGGALVGAALLASGRAPVGTVLLVGLFLLCPLMMLWMHGGGHQRGDGEKGQTRPDADTTPASTHPLAR